MVETALQPRGDLVFSVHVGVGKELEIIVLVMLQQRLEEIIDRMIAKIAGDISDPQPPVGVGHVDERAPAQQRCGHVGIETAGLIDELLMRNVGGVAQQHDQVIMRVDEVRLQADSGAIVLDGLGDLALRLERARKICSALPHSRA
jgi:hypothetical protein